MTPDSHESRDQDIVTSQSSSVDSASDCLKQVCDTNVGAVLQKELQVSLQDQPLVSGHTAPSDVDGGLKVFTHPVGQL